MSTSSSNRKLPLRVLIGFPLANFGPTLQTCIQMYFLLYFFTNVLGISGTAAAIIIMVARIWDFINDPLMGILVERTKRPDKCLFWMRVALVPVAIFMILTYTAPQFGTTGKIVWALLMFIGLGMSQTAYSIPLNSLRPKLTSDRAQRAKLGTFEGVFSIAANIIVPSVTMPFVAWLQGFPVSAPFTILAIVYATVYIIVGVIGLLMMRGSESEEVSSAISDRGEKVSAGEMLKTLLTNKVALLILLVQIIKMFISSTIGASMTYYYQYNIQNLNLMSLVNSIGGFIGVLPVLLLVPLQKKFGNAGTALIGCAVGLVALAIRFVFHDSTPLILVSMGILESIGVQLPNSMMVQCLMDSIDYGEWKTGNRPVAVIMSASGIGQKVGLAFGTSIAGFIIGALSFDPNAAVQPQNVLNSFFDINVVLPMVMYIGMALIFVYLIRIEKRLPQMRADIEARKQAAAQGK